MLGEVRVGVAASGERVVRGGYVMRGGKMVMCPQMLGWQVMRGTGIAMATGREGVQVVRLFGARDDVVWG